MQKNKVRRPRKTIEIELLSKRPEGYDSNAPVFKNGLVPHSKTRDSIEDLKEKIERLEFIVEGLAHAIEFQVTQNVLQETRKMLGK